ncbi:MAG: hypothetical protein HWE22_16630 [Flavobacteriales bacterium]|nr:hypothetical protein [Flavobacteriales bacterium]
MKKTVQILLLLILPFISHSQDNGDALFAESLAQMSRSKKLRNLIGTTYKNRNAMFFYYGNLQYANIPEDSSEYAIYLWQKKYLFNEPISCYMSIDSLGQKGNNFFVYFKVTGEGSEACNGQTGIARFKSIGKAKLELTKLKIK